MRTIPWTGACITMVLILMLTSSVLSEGQDTSLALQKITSDEELADYLSNFTPQYPNVLYETESRSLVRDAVMPQSVLPVMGEMKSAPSAREESALSQAGVGTPGGAKEYSSTNIQVAGVDEADFVKNDGTYIYMVQGATLSIVQAYPPKNAAITAQISIPGSVSDLFVDGDRLVVFTTRYDYSDTRERSRYFGPVSGERTSALVYDISDRSHPEKIREISAPGGYQNSRMIGDYIYFLTAGDRGYPDHRMPVILDDDHEIQVSAVWCPPHIVSNFQMNTLTSFPVTGSQPPEAISFLLGYDTTLYVSPTDVFIAYQKDPYGWNGISLEEDALVRAEPASPRQESVIHRFAISQGLIQYKATGTVPGSLLNQFSLDQYDGDLRVATTVDDWSSSQGKYSNVYVLNPALTIIGRLEHLAPGEKIYSARFMGDLLYLVTFKQTDPLFVIDLSNPNQPGILGELKIPGYSDYLHPYDSTHLIGIGKDTYENSGGGVIPTGIKVALFDVSDLNNPRLVDSRVIGEKGSDSAVLTDHRAFLLDKGKNIMVLPIKEVIHTPVPGSTYSGSYTNQVWQGAYVFGIDPKQGFGEKGRIEHRTGSDDESWWSGSVVRRSIFMDTILYTIDQNTIIGSDLNDLTNRVMKIEVSGSTSEPWYLNPLWGVING